jgi:chromatin structure-remodeling complex subunit RSC1/2
VDYLPQDIIEKVCVQFHPHYFTGRPRLPHWYPSWPIYMCEQRYDDRDRSFHHITNPDRCFPPSLRPPSTTISPSSQKSSNSIMHAPLVRNHKLDAIQPIYPFERLVFPLRKSGPNAGPRLPSSTGPTSFTIGPSDTKDGIGSAINGGGFDMGRDGRGRPKRMAAVKAANAVGTPVPGSPGSVMMAPGGNMGLGGIAPPPGDRTIISAAGGGMITAASVDKLPPETSRCSLTLVKCMAKRLLQPTYLIETVCQTRCYGSPVHL